MIRTFAWCGMMQAMSSARQPGAVEDFQAGAGHGGHRLLEGLLAQHVQGVELVTDIRRPRSGHRLPPPGSDKNVAILPVAPHVSRQNAPSDPIRSSRPEHDRARPVAEEDARIAVIPIDEKH